MAFLSRPSSNSPSQRQPSLGTESYSSPAAGAPIQHARGRRLAPRLTGLAPRLTGLALLVSLTPAVAGAVEPIVSSEPKVLSDTAVDLLEVADSFDGKDPFDINLRLSFDHEQRSAPIQREAASISTGGYAAENLNVATYNESTQRLIPEINIGILPEFALNIRMPLILAHNRKLSENGTPNGDPAAFGGAPGETLFSVPFESPTRAGIEYLAVGFDLGLMSQFRNPAHPNWVMGIEGRFNVSDPMRACNPSPAAGQVECAHSADINRNGVNDPLGPAFDALRADGSNLADELEGDFNGSRQAGVSRGTHAIEGHAYVSRRLKYIEPYTGIEALAEFQLQDSAYGATDLEGVIVNHPPLRGTVVAGMAVIPWEQPEKFSRIAFDLRVTGTYVSEGRDYSELFDALGSSDAYSLRAPNFSSYTANVTASGEVDAFRPSVVDAASTRVNFTGLTTVQQHGDYKLRAQFTWQAGEYVKFDLGATYRIIQAHFITFDQSCNPDFVGVVVRSGPCKVAIGSADVAGTSVPIWQSAGIPNPHHRKVINDPGRRYRVGASHGFQTWFRASVLF